MQRGVKFSAYLFQQKLMYELKLVIKTGICQSIQEILILYASFNDYII